MSSYSLSVLEKWLFRCWCNAIFVLLLVIIMALNSYGQIVTEGATVKVNFGIDADIYANDLTVFESPFTYDTDDWFINLDSFPGDGLGVIDQTTAASLLTAVQANYNTSFELRMSSTPSRNWIDPSTGLLWIDAVYFRDWNSQGNFNDESVFTSGQDKNGADPSTWSLGTGGTPQKNDLVDVMGHMRQDTNGDVYGIGAFTTISSDGNSHADFEFFQNQIDFVGGALTNLGPDAGHTAWEFDADNVTQVGDLIVSIDFENGGTNPQASVRLWMSDATFATLSGAIPSNVDFTLTGEFDSGEGADGYGYAEIEATGAFAVAWAIVNVNEAVLGAPWGSLEAKTWYENIQELQYAEFAINLTAIGIGDFGGADPCNKTLGSLMVKTRSSSSFTAELKDFAGPFLFGIELTTDVAVHDSEECQDEVSYNIDLTTNVDTTFGNIITYHNSYDDATQYLGVITDSTSHNIPLNEMPKTIYVRASNPQDIECFVVDSFTIGFYPNPVCDITSYDASNIYTYDGAAKVNTPDIVSYNWYTTDGLIGGGATTDSIWGLKGSLDGIHYYVDLEDSNGCTVTCTTTVYVGTYTPPDCTVEVVDATCDGYNNGSAKLQDVPPNWADYDYAWYKLPDEITVIGTDTMITSLDSGTYKLVITDNNLDVPQSTECEGTVSDRDPVTLTCPGDYLEITCTDPVDIKTHFDNWLAGVSVIGSDSMLTTDWDSINYPNACGDTITVTWTLHDECAIPNTCSATFRVPADLTDPVLANLPTGGDLGCNPTAPTCDDNVTASDNCDGDISAAVVCTPMAITGDDCDKAQTFMYTVEDECGNADTAYVNYSWKVDLIDPVLANLPTGGDLGCNPTAPTCDDNVTASDNCDGDISADVVCTPMAITGDDCNKAQTFMYTVEDECGNADTAYVNYTWKVDLIDPVLANLPTGGDLGCNPTAPSCDDNVTASDNCDGDISADVVCTPMAITGDDCNKAQTFMYTVEDECGNADTAYVNYTWKEDSEAPVVDSIRFMDSICNMEPEAMIWAYWTDNCDGSDSTSATPVWVEGTCPEVYGYTFHIEDECGNPTDTTVYVKKWMEQTGNCETVFGRLPEDADSEVVCFLDEGLFDRWGWTNQITMQDTTYVMDLYAGAAHCDTENRTPVGTVEVRWEGDSVVVDYMMNAGNYLEEVHVYVGYEKYPVMGNGKKQKQTVAPGQYTVVVEDEGYYTGAHVVISNVVDPFWIIAHGVACELTCVCYGEVDVNPDGVFILNGSNSIVDANDYPWWEEMDAEDLPPFNGSKRADASLERKKGQKSGNLLLDIEPTLQESELKVFPNPFDEVVNFEFVPAVSGHAVLEIHNMLGQRVVQLLDRPVEAGELQRVEFRPNSEISGVYLYRLDIDGNTQIGKIIYRNR